MRSNVPSAPTPELDLELFEDILVAQPTERITAVQQAAEADREHAPAPDQPPAAERQVPASEVGATVRFLTLERGLYVLSAGDLPSTNGGLPLVDIAVLPGQAENVASLLASASSGSGSLSQSSDAVVAKVRADRAQFCVIHYHLSTDDRTIELGVERLD
jgi:hypothetical protein